MKILHESDSSSITTAIKILHQGGIISFNCDTVYGLAVDASNTLAVEKLYQLKQRDHNKPLVIFLPDLAAAEKIFYFDEIAKKIAAKFMPGNLTMILKTRSNLPSALATNLNQNQQPNHSLGFRITKRQFVADLLKNFHGALAVTSANPSNKAAAITALEVENYFNNSELNLLIDGGEAMEKVASTVISVSDNEMKILRLGSIFEEQLKNSLNL